jgi:hypothetical protein
VPQGGKQADTIQMRIKDAHTKEIFASDPTLALEEIKI